MIEKAGVSREDLQKLLREPLNADAEQLLSKNEGMRTHGANQLVLEGQMLERAKNAGLEVGLVHGYGNYLQAWGI